MKKFLIPLLTIALALCLLPILSHDAFAVTEVKKGVEITSNGPSVGMAISDLTATVLKARLESIHVYNAYSGEEITEGCFDDNTVYYIHYALQPYEGQVFAEKVGIYLNGSNYKYLESESENRVVYVQTYTACLNITNVQMSMPTLQAGMKPEDVEITVPEDGHFRVDSFWIEDLQTNAEAEELRQDGQYKLHITLFPNNRYRFATSNAYCNKVRMPLTSLKEGTYAKCSIEFSLDVGNILIDYLQKDILEEGDSLNSTPLVTLAGLRVNKSATWWTDAEKNPVSGKAEGGKEYYLAFKIYALGPVGAWEAPVVIEPGYEITTEVIDGTTATVYVHYTALFDTGKVEVFPQGIAAEKPISDVTANLQGNVTLGKIHVQDETGTTVASGVFENGHTYSIRFQLDLLEGYSAGRNTKVYVNGEEFSYSESSNNKYITITIPLDTLYRITNAKVSLSGVGVGKTISKAKITAASGSKFDIYDHSWASTDVSSTKFKKGELYQITVTIEADDGYCFTKETGFTIGGKEAFDVTLLNSGGKLKGTVQFSYLTEVTKVSLPAMPKSITPGTTLPTSFKVSSSAKYTLQPVWLSMNTGEAVTMANKNGCYILAYVVTVKDGCEFTEDTVFYVDGKKVTPVVISSAQAQIMKPYNVGLTEVSRIDLTLPLPEHGAEPGEITVAADAPYTVATVSWGVNTTGKLEDGGDTVTTFQNYKYHFLAVEMTTVPGYIFADKVTLFINGDKYATLETVNLGVSYGAVVGFGKLGEIPKLTAPELSLDGLTLSWHGVPNADAYEVYRATSKSGKYTMVATVTDTTWTDTPTKGKTYYYKVKAIFTPDTTKNSGLSSYVTIAYKCDAPEIAVETGMSGKPVVSWEKVSGAKKYTVYRATSETGKYSKLGTTTKLTYTDSKAKAGTEYFYKVIANASKSTYNSGYSNIVSCPCICSAVTVTGKADAATGKPTISWKKVSGAAGYRILRQLPGEDDFTVIKEQTALTFLDADAPIDTRCVYLVQVIGKTEALSSRMSQEVTVTSGIARPVLQTSVDAGGKPELRWQTVEGAVKYEIYRSTKSTKGYTLLTAVEVTGYTDGTVAPGKTYYYKVVAVGAVSKSADSGYVKLSGKCATPEITAEINCSSGKPQLSWEKVTGAKKYTVYRATSETGAYKKLGTTTKLTYTDTKAAVGTTYYYKIVANASKSSYNSGYSNTVSCPASCAKPVVTASVAQSGAPMLTWKKVTGAAEYWILLDGEDGLEVLYKTDKTEFTDPTAAPGETRSYVVWAIHDDPLYNSPMTAVTVTAACEKPALNSDFSADGKPAGRWDTVEGAVAYKVYRSTKKSSGFKEVAELSTEGDFFIDDSAKKGKTYYYKIVAVCPDENGNEVESAFSNTIKIKSK